MAKRTSAGPRQTKQEMIYEKLRGRVLDGRYLPGYRIVIDQVASEFGVSALPVREAIRRLEAERLVVYHANAGAQVTPADPQLFEDEMTVLALLEGYATGLAAGDLTPEDFAALNHWTDEMESAVQAMDPLGFSEHNRTFHQVLHARCPNRSLAAGLSDVERRLAVIRRTVFVHIPFRGAASVAEHRHLISLLASGADVALIEATARNHKLRTVESFSQWRRSRREASEIDVGGP